MPPKIPRVTPPNIATSKRAKATPRYRGTVSQPVLVNSQLSQPLQLSSPPPPPPPPRPLSPRHVLVNASQAPNFEATLRESRAEDSITAPLEGSEHATAAASEAPDEESEEEIEAFDAHLMDNHNSLD